MLFIVVRSPVFFIVQEGLIVFGLLAWGFTNTGSRCMMYLSFKLLLGQATSVIVIFPKISESLGVGIWFCLPLRRSFCQPRGRVCPVSTKQTLSVEGSRPTRKSRKALSLKPYMWPKNPTHLFQDLYHRSQNINP